jgi:hypothetical protein
VVDWSSEAGVGIKRGHSADGTCPPRLNTEVSYRYRRVIFGRANGGRISRASRARETRGAIPSESTRPVRIEGADSFAGPACASCATTSASCKRKSLGHLFILHSLPIFYLSLPLHKALAILLKGPISYMPVPASCFKWRGASSWRSRLVSNLKALSSRPKIESTEERPRSWVF